MIGAERWLSRVDRLGPSVRAKPAPAGGRVRLQAMWDVLKWQNDTLSIAWWALVAFALLVIIAAGSRAAKK
jgi:hypothetical protein